MSNGEQRIDPADFLQRFSTKALWHFTGYNKTAEQSFDILKKILSETKLRLGQPDPIIMPDGERRTCFPYSCMCDIPFKDLRIHTLRYGPYGIAFNKTTAILRGHFNPVMYVHKDAFLFSHAGKVLKDIDTLIKPHAELSDKLYQHLSIIGTYIKRSDLTAHVNIGDKVLDKEQNNNFYYEREWRSAYEWTFGKGDVLAVMVQNNDLAVTRALLRDKGLDGVTVISYEMIDML